MTGGYDRRKRIRRLKKIILGTIAAAIIIPVIVSILLGVRVVSLESRVKELEAMLLTEKEKSAGADVFTSSGIEESARNKEEDVQQDTEDLQADTDGIVKEVYLTFDDGPSANTDKILDVLKEYDVHATFFVVGKTDEHSTRMYQRIVDEGHTLAMHSYSHKYDEIYESKESFVEDLTKLQEYLYQITGIWPRYYRFPGGSSNTVSNVEMQELIAYLNENGITYFDWNISSGDAVREDLSVDAFVDNCVNKLDSVNIGMILMHDAKDKVTTVEALPEVIKVIQERGDTVILPITDETKPVQHVLSTNIN
ncbi:polysaccharide deacetylase family protein [Parablautia muri]|uniref:Polysaccharide deacetylase n=1 Tax=Parablautia muri TaxID=2320879 RepID=A0A9X5BGW6_9FIRM|nr:polysaccharide deacetylase family protein [Parablautia muri]NBJ93479.1 polysaccharide deacetylase [Parablautia muri]